MKALTRLENVLEKIKNDTPDGAGGISWDYSDATYQAALEFVLFHGEQIHAAMSKWLPIDTAPRDGTRILLYFPEGCWITDNKITDGFYSTDGSEDWYHSECDSTSLTDFGQHPTMWMLIHAPVQEAK